MRPSAPAAPVLVVCALVGGLLQILASIHLGLQRLDALTAAAHEGPAVYLLAIVGATVGLGALWVLRKRPLVAAVAFLLWQLAVLWPLARRMSSLGLSLHGEFVLHHFVALVSAAACLSLAVALARESELGRARWIAVLAATVGASTALVAHVLSAGHMGVRLVPALHGVAAVAILGAAVVWFAIDVRVRGSTLARWAAVPLVLPFVVRLAASGPGALADVAVPGPWRALQLGVLVGCAFAITVLVRPRPSRSVAIAITISTALTIAMIYLVYRRDFGEVEDGLGGLAQSLLGFVPPYPSYVPPWVLVVAMLGAFSALHTAAGAMATTSDRDRGTALALVIIAGVGLSSPQLVLMTGAGLLAFVAHRRGGSAALPPSVPMTELLAEAATRLHLSLATVPGARAGAELSALRGSIGGVAVDLRAQTGPAGAKLRARIGLPGRGRPIVALAPDVGDAGARPAHEIGRSHRVVGDARELERWGDALLDALHGLGTASAKLWSTGAEIEFGSDLSTLDAERIDRVVRAAVDVLRDT